MRINRTFAKCALAVGIQVTAFLGCAAWVGSANQPQQAAARPVLGATARELAAVIVSGDTVGIDGRTYRGDVIMPAPVTWPHLPRAAAIREVSSTGRYAVRRYDYVAIPGAERRPRRGQESCSAPAISLPLQRRDTFTPRQPRGASPILEHDASWRRRVWQPVLAGLSVRVHHLARCAAR